MNELTHDRCSELLGAFASDELDARDRPMVQAHLSSCRECSSELAAIEALRGAEVVPMTGVERDRLTSAVKAAVMTPARPGWSVRWGRKAAPALGAVALVTIVAVAVVSLPQGSDEPQPASGGVDRTDPFESGEAEMKAAPLPKAQDATTETLEQDAADAGGRGGDEAPGTTSTQVTGSTALRAAAGTVVSEQSFAAVGLDLGSLVPQASPQHYASAGRSVDPLVASAPGRRVADLIQTCSDRAMSSSPKPLVATSATYFPSDDVLLIGFVWVDSSTGDLFFEVRGWRDGRCDRVTPIFSRGVVGQ